MLTALAARNSTEVVNHAPVDLEVMVVNGIVRSNSSRRQFGTTCTRHLKWVGCFITWFFTSLSMLWVGGPRRGDDHFDSIRILPLVLRRHPLHRSHLDCWSAFLLYYDVLTGSVVDPDPRRLEPPGLEICFCSFLPRANP